MIEADDPSLQHTVTGQHVAPARLAVYDQVARRWRTLPDPPTRSYFAGAPVWTGTELLVLTDHDHLFALGPTYLVGLKRG
jgi:hypothetical protein